MEPATTELTSTARAAIVTKMLLEGKRLKAVEVAEATGLLRESAYRLLNRLALVLPLHNECGLWYLVDREDKR